MPSNSLAVSGQTLLENQRRAMKRQGPVSSYLKILAQEMAPGEDYSYSEALARKAWNKALSDDKESLHWALLVLERTEGKVAQKVQLDNPNELIEQIYGRLVDSGMPMVQIRNVLVALGVDEKFLPAVEALEAEIVNG